MKNKTVKDIVKEYLKANGYDGLYNDAVDCACKGDQLFCCGEVGMECKAGCLQPSDDDSEYEFVIGPTNHKKEKIQEVDKIDIKEAEKFLEEATGYKARCVYDESLGLIEASLYGVPSTDLYRIDDLVCEMEQEKYPSCGVVFLVQVYEKSTNNQRG